MRYSTSIGIDAHAKKNEVCAISNSTGEVVRTTLSEDPEELIRWIEKQELEKPFKCVYESGPTGFILARALEEAGIECVIAAVSKLPERKDRRKNDRLDAEWLARMLIAGSVKAVWVPSVEAESMRNLSRLRGEIAKDLARAKLRVASFLLITGVKYTAGRQRWTGMFRTWAESFCFPAPADTFVFREKLACVYRLEEQLTAVECEIMKMIDEYPELSDLMNRFLCIHGVGKVTAFSLVCEVGDFSRFPNGRAFAAYLGLMPSESSTGDKVSHGKITKTGNSHIRRIIVEAASAYSRPFLPVTESKMDPSVPALVRERAVKCSERLKKRRKHLIDRGKNTNKAKCAIARELAEWMYHIAVM